MAERRKRSRVEKVQVYLSKDVARERIALDIWKACVESDRPQNVFREIMFHGIRAMVDGGYFPEAVLKQVKGLAAMGSPARTGPPPGYQPAYQPAYQPPAPTAYAPSASADWQPPPPAPEPRPAPEPEKARAMPPPSALLGLMGS